ncbi:MAG TPA: hypothetical protein IAA66_00970 [Candidatus Avichristensenella intestinipullorum]|uniref:Uncharacterized protein n=1 Tax=Candidatus Avichristensenella intestinipullorum TaxID=2840693 RepID=A0A9D0YUD9_9FIRM|nr:hypothetical protein [Candidatus Avichristensenella intestinipullorum]
MRCNLPRGLSAKAADFSINQDIFINITAKVFFNQFITDRRLESAELIFPGIHHGINAQPLANTPAHKTRAALQHGKAALAPW